MLPVCKWSFASWQKILQELPNELLPADKLHFRIYTSKQYPNNDKTVNGAIDSLVEYDRLNERISLMRIAGMMIGLEDLLHRKVDLIESGKLLPFAQDNMYLFHVFYVIIIKV